MKDIQVLQMVKARQLVRTRRARSRACGGTESETKDLGTSVSMESTEDSVGCCMLFLRYCGGGSLSSQSRDRKGLL